MALPKKGSPPPWLAQAANDKLASLKKMDKHKKKKSIKHAPKGNPFALAKKKAS
jgi:hypothetical protein